MFRFLTRSGRLHQNVRISTKILIAFAAVLVCTAGFGATALDRMNAIDAAAAEVRSHWLPRTGTLGELLFLGQRFRAIEAALVMAEPDARVAEAKTLDALAKRISDSIAKQREFAISDAERAHVGLIAETWSAYFALDQKLVELARQDDSRAASNLYRGEMRDVVQRFLDELLKEVASNVVNGDDAAHRSAEVGVGAGRDTAATIGVEVALCGLIGIALSRTVSRPIAALTSAARALEQRDFSFKIPALEVKSEIGDLARSIDVLKSAAIQRQRLEADSAAAIAANELERERAIAERDRLAEDQALVVRRL